MGKILGEHVILLDLVMAIMGFLIRWLLHMNSAREKCIAKKKRFGWKVYATDNIILVVTSFIATLALVFAVPQALEKMDMINNWNSLVAIGCGISNLEIIKLLRGLVQKRTGIENPTEDCNPPVNN